VAAPSSNARKHESTNPALRLVLGHFRRTLCRVVRGLRPRTVFDVGCGEGYMLAAVRAALQEAGIEATYAGVDISDDAIAAARARLGPDVELDQGDVRALAAGRRFDVVMMLEVLEHLDDPAPMLDVLAGITGGHVVLSVPHEPLFRGLNLLRGHHLRRLGNHPEHVQQFSRAGFLAFVARRFEIVAAPIVPPWTMVVARRRP
jgi:2-polyprenyl-3-methyl-5-hydroxy-6-metoxy-1,4-benzoquinol methylase